jgi:hypothetical protein
MNVPMNEEGLGILLRRYIELSSILIAMKCAQDMKRFWELNKKFQDTSDIYKLEDSLNSAG